MFFSAQVAFATTITFWTTETQSERMKTIQLILDTFEALNDDIKVNLVAVDENDFPTQMVAATSAGNIPEVINMGSELAVAFDRHHTSAVTDGDRAVQTSAVAEGLL